MAAFRFAQDFSVLAYSQCVRFRICFELVHREFGY
jgi:hypothetical protein